MSDTQYSATNALVDIFAAPSKALDEIMNHTSWLWWPLLIIMLGTIALTAWYHNWVDLNWLIDNEIRKIPPEARAQSADAVREFLGSGVQTYIAIATVVVFSLIVYALTAVWFHLANKLTSGADIGYGQWFSFACWTNFPSVISILAAFVVIFMAESNQMPAEKMQALSLNQLFIHAEQGEPWFNWGNAVSIIHLWMIALMSIGFSRWTHSSLGKSIVVAALPWVLIFGTWAAMI